MVSVPEIVLLSTTVDGNERRAVSSLEEDEESSPVNVVGGVSSPPEVSNREERREGDFKLIDQLSLPIKMSSSSEQAEGVPTKRESPSGCVDWASWSRLLLVRMVETSGLVYVVLLRC